MPLRKYIRNGIRFLLTNQNDDGGIPATKPNELSGCWTTAEALEVFLVSPHFPKESLPKAKDMVNFLIKTQLPAGGWPLLVDNEQISTMATGHALAALAISEKVFSSEIQLINEIKNTIKSAEEWLRNHQNDDGGWGVEPEIVNGKDSRMISTCYALRGYFECNYTVENSKSVRGGVEYITKISNKKDGGWGGISGADSDPANTARAITALIRSKKFGLESPTIKKGIEFILKTDHRKILWEVDTESYVATGAPGETIFSANTPYDVLDLFMRCNYFGNKVNTFIKWFIKNQDDDGRWYLTSSRQTRPISTWPTSEAISVLDLSQEHYIKNIYETFDKKLTSRWKPVIMGLSIIVIAQFAYIFNIHSIILSKWESLPESWKQGIIFGIIFSIIIALIIGIIVNLVTPIVISNLEKLKSHNR